MRSKRQVSRRELAQMLAPIYYDNPFSGAEFGGEDIDTYDHLDDETKKRLYVAARSADRIIKSDNFENEAIAKAWYRYFAAGACISLSITGVNIGVLIGHWFW